MKIEIDVNSVVIVSERNGSEYVYFNLKNPSPIWPFERENLTMKFQVAKGKGKDYVKEHFPDLIDIIEIINVT